MSCPHELTILCDNRAGEGFQEEHGLSILISTRDLKILFDTGSGETLLKNAMSANISLGQIDYLVLSHGHSDHTGGIPDVLKRNEHLMVAAHPQSLVARVSRHKSKPVKQIGMTPEVAACLQQYVITSYSIHYTKLYECGHLPVAVIHERG